MCLAGISNLFKTHAAPLSRKYILLSSACVGRLVCAGYRLEDLATYLAKLENLLPNLVDFSCYLRKNSKIIS